MAPPALRDAIGNRVADAADRQFWLMRRYASKALSSTSNLLHEDEPQAASRKSRNDGDWTPTEGKAIETADGSDGRMDVWAPLSAAGACVRKLDPGLDPRSFGHKSLTALIKSRPEMFQTRADETKDGASVIHVMAVD